LSGRSTPELVIVFSVSRILLLALLATLLATLLTALLRVSSWCLLALFLTVVLTFTSLTHVSEIVVLHSVICHGCLLLPLFVNDYDRSSTTSFSGQFNSHRELFNERANLKIAGYREFRQV
jgi:hypothetical protein